MNEKIDFWVVLERNYARNEEYVKTYFGKKSDALDYAAERFSDTAFNGNYTDAIESVDNSKTSAQLFKKEGTLHNDFARISIGDYAWTVEHLTEKNLNEYDDIDPYGVLNAIRRSVDGISGKKTKRSCRVGETPKHNNGKDFPAEMLISAIGSPASRKKFINEALSALTGEPIVTQFMGDNRFLFQFSGKNPEAIRKIKGLFEKQYESFYDEYDSDTNTTAIYMKI